MNMNIKFFTSCWVFIWFPLPCRVHQNFPIPSMLRSLPLSPPPSFILPVYVEQAAALMSTVMSPRPQHEVRNYDNGVFKYLDLQAQEGIGSEDSSDDME